MLPFTVDEFFAVFAAYNQAVWPAQWALYGVATAVAGLAASSVRGRDRWISGLLGCLWAWMAIAYHFVQFSRINPLAYAFAFMFLLQAGLFLRISARPEPMRFSYRQDLYGRLSIALILYALVVYPALTAALGHHYPAAPTFGVPCPTTIFTLGVLCSARTHELGALLILPVLWSFVGGSAAFLLDVPQDLGLLVAGLLTLVSAAARIRPASR